MSKAIITAEGYVKNNPEVRYTGEGMAVTSVDFTHTPKTTIDKKFVPVGDTIFFQAIFWGKDAIATADFVSKGDYVTVSGKPEINLFERRDGEQGVTIRIKYSTLGVVPPKLEENES